MILFLCIAVLTFFIVWVITDEDALAFVVAFFVALFTRMILPDYAPVYYEENSQEICLLSTIEEKYICTSEDSHGFITYKYIINTENGKKMEKFSGSDYTDVYIKEDSTQTPQIVVHQAKSKWKLFSSWDDGFSHRSYVVFIVPEGSATVEDYHIL